MTPDSSLIGALVLAALLASPTTARQAEGANEDETFEARLQALEERYAEEVEDLQFELEFLNERLDRLVAAENVSSSPNVFNPLISIVGTLLARADDREVLNHDGDPIDDSLRLSEVELDFRSTIDPWAEGVVIAAFESEATGEYTATIEEGYVVLRRLPFTESAPGGVRLKVGRFRVEFGRINKVHTHNLPWSTRPLPVQKLLGDEGYVREGVSGSFALPTWSEDESLDLTVQVLAGGGIPFHEDAPSSAYAQVGHLAWFRELSPEQTLELGLSGRGGDSDRLLWGADFTYSWKPFEGGLRRSLLVGGEVFLNDTDAPGLDRARGSYLWAQWQLSRRLYLGTRYDFAEELDNRALDTRRAGAWLSFYTTEFFRARVGYEHTESDVAALDGLDSGFLELSFVFGSHPNEPYWVNR